MAAGAVSIKNLTKREEVRKGADQAKCIYYMYIGLYIYKYSVISIIYKDTLIYIP